MGWTMFMSTAHVRMHASQMTNTEAPQQAAAAEEKVLTLGGIMRPHGELLQASKIVSRERLVNVTVRMPHQLALTRRAFAEMRSCNLGEPWRSWAVQLASEWRSLNRYASASSMPHKRTRRRGARLWSRFTLKLTRTRS